MVLMQFDSAKIHFIPLADYQAKRTDPHLTVTHFLDFAETKDLVLMVGKFGNTHITVEQAQNLVYQAGLFYVNGTKAQKALLECFWKRPNDFSHQKLIDSLTFL